VNLPRLEGVRGRAIVATSRTVRSDRLHELGVVRGNELLGLPLEDLRRAWEGEH
jgi:hypothetical protein